MNSVFIIWILAVIVLSAACLISILAKNGYPLLIASGAGAVTMALLTLTCFFHTFIHPRLPWVVSDGIWTSPVMRALSIHDRFNTMAEKLEGVVNGGRLTTALLAVFIVCAAVMYFHKKAISKKAAG